MYNSLHDRRKKDNNGNHSRSINTGDIIHIVQIAVLLMSLGIMYEKFQVTETQVQTHTNQLNNIEHYLSSKDPNYWTIVREQN